MFIKMDRFCFKAPINVLNAPSEFDDTLIVKKVTTHRIVNLMNLTKIH